MSIPNDKMREHLKDLYKENFSLNKTENYLQIYVEECLQRCAQSFSLILPYFPPDSDSHTLFFLPKGH